MWFISLPHNTSILSNRYLQTNRPLCAQHIMGKHHGIPGLVDDYNVKILEGGMPKEASHSIKTIGPSRRAPFHVAS